ncbi:hypothetical protein [Yersinia mollaretii]|uniref:hypothetical protein n=1 Tax=Yersinia mollaretii TaxID=33060 RepID=UPI0011A98E90|nr:hypothetical protein [Yersinia mollaretii]
MLSKEPERIHHDWDAAVVAHCDFCSHSEMTVPHADGGKICASCCDAEALSNWQSYARDVVSELRSLREQLEAIKSQKPSYWLDFHGYQTYLYFNEKDATEACGKNGGLYVKPVYDGPTVAAVQDIKAIEDDLIEQVGLMCDRAVNIHEKNIYGEAFCVLKYGILPYLRKQGK